MEKGASSTSKYWSLNSEIGWFSNSRLRPKQFAGKQCDRDLEVKWSVGLFVRELWELQGGSKVESRPRLEGT